MTFSQRTTFAHWLISTGRSRHDFTHFAYIVPMMHFRRRPDDEPLFELFVAAAGDPRHLRREPFDVLLLLHQEALGNEQREVRVHVAGRLEPRVEQPLDVFPDRVAVRPDDHAALDGRVVGQLGAADDVEIPAREVLGAGRDLGDERFFFLIGQGSLYTQPPGSSCCGKRSRPVDLSFTTVRRARRTRAASSVDRPCPGKSGRAVARRGSPPA